MRATIGMGEAAARRWDVIVVGTGMAGAAVAHGLARRGMAVLMVEKGRHPRAKACGGCLHPRGVALMEEMGMGGLLPAARCDAVELREPGAPVVRLPLGRPFRVVDRAVLDAAMVGAAVGAGAEYLCDCTVVGSSLAEGVRRVDCRAPGGGAMALRGALVVAADGLNSVLARGAGLVRPARSWWRPKVGVSAEGEGPVSLDLSAITMLCAGWGYLGVVAMGAGRWHLAAAVQAGELARHGTRGIIHAALEQHGLAGMQLLEGTMATTPALTRRLARPWAERLLVVGDAAGYMEPITGEGMTWALAGARAAVAAAAGGWHAGTGVEYAARWRREVARRRRWVRLAAMVLDRPALRRVAWRLMAMGDALPAMAGRMATGGPRS